MVENEAILRVFQRPHNSNEILLLSKDTVSKFPDRYTVESNSTTYNLIVKSATYQDDGEFECDIGDIESKKARIYIWGMRLVKFPRCLLFADSADDADLCCRCPHKNGAGMGGCE